jgi:hypothetical protein
MTKLGVLSLQGMPELGKCHPGRECRDPVIRDDNTNGFSSGQPDRYRGDERRNQIKRLTLIPQPTYSLRLTQATKPFPSRRRRELGRGT